MPDEKQPFWSSMPGILSGIAAVLTALTGLFIVFNKDTTQNNYPNRPIDSANVSSQFHSTVPANNSQENLAGEAVDQFPQKSWPIIAFEKFEVPNPKWWIDKLNDPSFFWNEAKIYNGAYRWHINFASRYRWQYIYPDFEPAVNFYLACDVKFIECDSTKGLGLMFGLNQNKYYFFVIWSANSYGIIKWDGSNIKEIIPYTSMEIDLNKTHHLVVISDNLFLKFYVDSRFAGEVKDETFSGGKVGVVSYGWNSGVSIADFDNFEYRRKPN